MKTRAFIVVGIGHHARRIYVPELAKHSSLTNVELVLIDISEAEPVIHKYLEQKQIKAHQVIGLNGQDRIDFEGSTIAQKLLAEYDILGVVISTDPLNHMQYASWAVKNNLHVLCDKPLSTHVDVATSEEAAINIQKDYQDLLELYKKGTGLFCLSTQRRYESAYEYVGDKLAEVAQKFNMPVTSVQSFYSDGLWIFPDELVNQNVHPFNRGYGMLSHSGFHLLDALWSFYRQGSVQHKLADTMEVHASAIYPEGYIKNFGTHDYNRVFDQNVLAHDDHHYSQKFDGYGEMDISADFLLQKANTHIASMSVKMLHNSFSRRSWSQAKEDLYKGNGRVKHQTFTIQQGPFQSIQLHNYQAVAEHDSYTDEDTYALGGKNHFDIQIFRNADMFGGNTRPVEKLSSRDINQMYAKSGRLANEVAKSVMIDEFVGSCIAIKTGRATRDMVKVRNDLPSYNVPVKMMSNLYRSLARRKMNKHALVGDVI